jgi:hypothetical protein
MAFYVAVGPRGLLFRVGLILTGVLGTPTYWWASRRRHLRERAARRHQVLSAVMERGRAGRVEVAAPEVKDSRSDRPPSRRALCI